MSWFVYALISAAARGDGNSRQARRRGCAVDAGDRDPAWVAPIDKLSLPFTIVLAILWLGGSLTWHVAAGVTLMVIGALLTRA